ncbi:hypothetical protein GALMADRAFT_419513 [Galerina marginata CBS 339.88]|uniref:F-box domain-containing protein n=1 Tax=Galerina marginata (strain CBS 339.88) TaxID=685588 RepID=A0A067T3Q4_GALM3|nr:hypothetical protein GALMADRAFT_419513 [Galerina marginata CBS 339.88]
MYSKESPTLQAQKLSHVNSDNAPASIVTLPTELLSLVLSFCRDYTLLALAQTCTRLNTVALHLFFARNTIKQPASKLLGQHTMPRGTLDALRMALFVKQLSHIRWYFTPGWKTDEDKIEGWRSADESNCVSGSGRDISQGALIPGTGPLRRTFDELANLHVIISRLTSVKSVRLDFGLVDDWTVSRKRNKDQQEKQVDMQLWRRQVGALLDGILDKGCEVLHVIGGVYVNGLFLDQEMGQEAEPLQDEGEDEEDNYRRQRRLSHVSKALIGLVRHAFKPSIKRSRIPIPIRDVHTNETQGLDPISPHTERKALKLKALHIESAMILLPPFLDWTLSLLTSPACGSTLTHLSFEFSSARSPVIPSNLLSSLHLPNLARFEIASSFLSPREGPTTKFKDISQFLARHSRGLKRIYLSGVELPPQTKAYEPQPEFVSLFDSRRPIFPMLENVTAHPAYITWMLDSSVTLSPGSSLPSPSIHTNNAWTDYPSNKGANPPNSLGNLKGIGIISDYHISQNFEYALFDDALRAVVSFCRWRDEQRRGSQSWFTKTGRSGTKIHEPEEKEYTEKSITLMLQFACESGVSQWFADHLRLASSSLLSRRGSTPGTQRHPSGSILTQLTHISTLVISGFRWVSFPRDAIANLPEWLALVFGASSQNMDQDSAATFHELKFVEQQRTDVVRLLVAKDFVTRVARKCVRLNCLEVEGKPFDLDEIRRLGEGD